MRAIFLLITIAIVGCDAQHTALLLPKKAVTPAEWSGPALGRDLPLYAWWFQLPEDSPNAKYRIGLEIRRPGFAPEAICELSPEYLANRKGKDVVISVTRPGTSTKGHLTDTQFQIRLLDSNGEATAIVANNNNCLHSNMRDLLNRPYQFHPLEPKASSEILLWDISGKDDQQTAQVVVTAERR